MLKKVYRISQIQSFISWLISVYLKLCYHSSDWKIQNRQNIEDLIKKNKIGIICFWHGRLLMMPYCWNYDKKFSMLISSHSDGILISKTISYFGIDTIIGSSSKNKFSSFKNIIKEIKSKNFVGITPDGPRGPERKVKDGIISLAKLTNVPLIPLTYGSKHNKIMNSWDKFILTTPFNKLVAIWGNPIYVRKNSDVEKKRKELEDELNRITILVDNLLR